MNFSKEKEAAEATMHNSPSHQTSFRAIHDVLIVLEQERTFEIKLYPRHCLVLGEKESIHKNNERKRKMQEMESIKLSCS